MQLPNFLVIGVMKGGTTSLHEYLSKHPDIFMTDKKEINFFIDPHWSNGIEWYSNFFDESGKYLLRGESSPSYSKAHRHKLVVSRIKEVLPEVKLIYIVRNPIDRILSHYIEAIEGGYAPDQDINEFIFNDPEQHYILTSRYGYQLAAYLKEFSLENIIVISSEDLLKHRLGTMNKIFEFLGVTIIDDNEIFDFKINTQKEKRKKSLLGKLIYGRALQNIRNLVPRELKDKLKDRKWLQVFTHSKISNHSLNEESVFKLKKIFKLDIQELEQMTGQSFKDWNI
jgi:hypothetical protein